jgi:hypothetical protein
MWRELKRHVQEHHERLMLDYVPGNDMTYIDDEGDSA